MKKTSFLVIVVLLLMTFNAVADDFEFVGGTSLSKLEFELGYDIESNDETVTDESLAGNGFYGGVRYILDNGLGFGAGYDTLEVTQGIEEYREASSSNYYEEWKYEDSTTYKLSGPYIEMFYKIKEMITLKGGLVFNKLLASREEFESYYYEDYYYEDIDKYSDEYKAEMKGEGIGYQLGAELEHPFTDNLSITGTVSYRFGNLDITHIYSDATEKFEKLPDDFDILLDYSGYSFGFGLNYAF